MEQWEATIKKLVELMGFTDYRVEIDPEHKRGSVFIYDNPTLVKENLPVLVSSINHLVQLMARKLNEPAVIFDVNNYRQERENLIGELAKAAAKKVHATKERVSLPIMNSYERRIVHTELAIHPDVTTESVGEGKERYVIVKPVEDK